MRKPVSAKSINSHPSKLVVHLSTAVVTAALLQQQVLAQGKQNEAVLEEVTVTARKRAESIVDSPVSMTTFSETTIEQAGIQSMRDYVGLVPNVSIVETQNTGFAFINVRGLSQLRNTDPTVAMVIDGVLSTTPLNFSEQLFDVQQIEFLKGPQGALYGRNALGGAINISTKQPSTETEGMIRASAGNGDAFGLQGSVSGPISGDSLLGRLSVSYRDADGWRDNIFLGEPADPYEDFSTRGKVLWFPSESVTVDLRASYADTQGAAQQFVVNTPQFQASNPNSPVPPFLQVTGGDTVFVIPEGASPISNVVSDPNNVSVPIQGNILGLDIREAYTFSSKIDWEVEAGTWTFITAYEEVEQKQGGEQLPYTSFAVEKATNYRLSEALSQEIRFTSPVADRFRWIAGAYVVATEFFQSNGRVRDDSGLNFSESDIMTTQPFRLGPNGDGIDPTTLFQADDNDNFAYAVFLQGSYDINEQLELTFSARYDEDERKQIAETPNDFIFDFVDIAQGDSRTETFSSFQPQLTLRYKPADNITWYATYSEGFRSGGFNPSGAEARAAELRENGNLAVPAGIQDVFDQEETQNVELGFKFQSDNQRMQFNAAAFATRIDDQQLFNVVFDLNTAQIIRNIDEVEVIGFEADATLFVTNNLILTAGLGFIDTEIKQFDAEPNTVGNKAPLNPENTINIGLIYEQDFAFGGAEVSGYARIDYQRLGETWWEPANFASRDPIDLVNLRLGLQTQDESWALAAWVKNATDENYFAEVTSPPGANYYAPLRAWGLELTKRF